MIDERIEFGLDIHKASGLPLELCGALADDLWEKGYRMRSEVAREIFEWFEENAVNCNFITGNVEINLARYLEFKKTYTE